LHGRECGPSGKYFSRVDPLQGFIDTGGPWRTGGLAAEFTSKESARTGGFTADVEAAILYLKINQLKYGCATLKTLKAE